MGRFDELTAPITSLSGTSWAAGSLGLVWYEDELFKNLGEYPAKLREAIALVVEDFQEYAEGWMKDNAPWDDRTGDAREGLRAEAKAETLKQTLELYHTVDYGIWLEVRWSGLYAIIVPSLEKLGPELMDALSTVMRYYNE